MANGNGNSPKRKNGNGHKHKNGNGSAKHLMRLAAHHETPQKIGFYVEFNGVAIPADQFNAEPQVVKGKTNSVHRVDWEKNHQVIMDAYVTVASEKKRLPTIREIAEVSGYNRDTVADHFRQMKLDPILKGIRAHTETVLRGLTARAASGRAPEVELWFWLAWALERKLNLHHSGSVDVRKVDVRSLTFDQLERLRNGETPEKVLSEHVN